MMRFILITICLLLVPLFSIAQFGFERYEEIPVLKDGEFLKFPWAGGMDFCQFSNIDLDFDGTQDLFVFDRTCNKVMTFIQNGASGESDFVYAPEYEQLFPSDLHDWTLLADYNCDGVVDIFTAAIGGGRVYRNIGNEIDGHSFELVSDILTTYVYDDLGYLYLSPADIPAIVDIDGDSDLDILGFGVLGRSVEYHRNMSIETYGVCDSLIFETKNICWGRFREAAASNDVTLWDTLEYPCRDEDLTEEFALRPEVNQDRHAGSSLLALDYTNSGVMDLVLGDISFSNMTLLLNEGEEVNTNSGMYDQDNAFPSTSIAVDLPIFPAAYHVDINNDEIRDLLVSPNSKIGSQNIESVWSYTNENEDLEPEFIFERVNFLQEEMMDHGTSSYPVFFDANGDGLKDLLVSSQGQYDVGSGNQISKLAYYENTGTATTPEFILVTDDYEDLSTLGMGESLVFYPTFGDLDGDGDEDMIMGEYLGYCYYLENTGGPGNPAIFNTFTLLKNSEGEAIFEGTYAYPQLVDIDRDGDNDLVIGRRTGKLHYYENTGTDEYNFEFKTNYFGAVDVSGDGFIEGHAIPQFVSIEDEYHLVVGSKRGQMFYYDEIEDNIEGGFHLANVFVDNIHIGTYSAPAIVNLTDDNRFEMALGNRRGGVGFYRSAELSNIGIEDLSSDFSFTIYPNPTDDIVQINLGTMSKVQLEEMTIEIFNLQGILISKLKPIQNLMTVQLENFAAGTYIVTISNQGNSKKEKLVVLD